MARLRSVSKSARRDAAGASASRGGRAPRMGPAADASPSAELSAGGVRVGASCQGSLSGVAEPDPYSTHLAALMWALSVSIGRVLEVGCGYYSTPWLHEYCAAANRYLVSYETSPVWRQRFATMYESRDHVFPEMLPKTPIEGMYGVVLVDGEWAERVWWVDAVRGHAERVVVHDTNPGAVRMCRGMREALAGYPHRRDFVDQLPHTAVVW